MFSLLLGGLKKGEMLNFPLPVFSMFSVLEGLVTFQLLVFSMFSLLGVGC